VLVGTGVLVGLGVSLWAALREGVCVS